VEVSPDLVRTVTDAVVAEVTGWQCRRPIEPTHPLVFFEAPRVKIRDDAAVRSKAVCLALAVLPDSRPARPVAMIRAVPGFCLARRLAQVVGELGASRALDDRFLEARTEASSSSGVSGPWRTNDREFPVGTGAKRLRASSLHLSSPRSKEQHRLPAFYLRLICVLSAFYLRSICVLSASTCVPSGFHLRLALSAAIVRPRRMTRAANSLTP
jgi:Transposase, Mutator family